MMCAATDFREIFLDFRRRLRIVQGDVVQTDDGVHRSTDLMGHVGKENRFRLAGVFGGRQGVAQCVALLDKLVLQDDTFAKLRLLSPQFRFRCLLLQLKTGVRPVLFHDIDEDAQKNQGIQCGQDGAFPYELLVDVDDSAADDMFADQIGQHPVSAFNRYIAHRFVHAAIRERNDAFFSFLEILPHRFKGVALF